MVSTATRRLEVSGGLLLLVVSPATIDRVVTSLTQHELSEDPHDVLAPHLLRTTHGLTGSGESLGVLLVLQDKRRGQRQGVWP
jgi:uncharacterized membrane protein